MNWTIICVTNNDKVLKSCLLSSPEIQSASDVILQRGFSSAGAAYNAGMEKAESDILVFAHQDVYLPVGWVAAVEKAVEVLAKQDPRWAVLGIWGVQRSGLGVGNLYCAGLMQRLGQTFEMPKEVRSLDEAVLIVRKSAGVRFDENLPSFHMYGTDICQEANRQGMKCYAISAFCIHNTNGYNMLPWDYWKCYFLMRKKWKQQLPIATPCSKITFWCWPMIRWNIKQALNIMLKRHKPGKRVQDPGRLYQENLVSVVTHG
jgi:GT2 family glycosyltransferase